MVKPLGSLATAALILFSAGPARTHTIKDGVLVLPYAFKTGAATYLAYLAVEEGRITTTIASGAVVLGVAVPDLLVLAALASGGGEALESRRRLAFWTEMGTAAGLFIMGAYHVSDKHSRDQIGLVYIFLVPPILLLAQLNHIPFDAEVGGPPPPASPVLRISIPF